MVNVYIIYNNSYILINNKKIYIKDLQYNYTITQDGKYLIIK